MVRPKTNEYIQGKYGVLNIRQSHTLHAAPSPLFPSVIGTSLLGIEAAVRMVLCSTFSAVANGHNPSRIKREADWCSGLFQSVLLMLG